MKNFIGALMIGCLILSIVPNITACDNVSISDGEIDKILRAKEIVRSMVNYPDTLVFHEFDTRVSGNTVTLKFTCKNGFGVPETHVMDIKVN